MFLGPPARRTISNACVRVLCWSPPNRALPPAPAAPSRQTPCCCSPPQPRHIFKMCGGIPLMVLGPPARSTISDACVRVLCWPSPNRALPPAPTASSRHTTCCCKPSPAPAPLHNVWMKSLDVLGTAYAPRDLERVRTRPSLGHTNLRAPAIPSRPPGVPVRCELAGAEGRPAFPSQSSIRHCYNFVPVLECLTNRPRA